MKKSLQVAVLIGSESDRNVMNPCLEQLEKLGIECEMVVSSAHRQPKETIEYIEHALSRGTQVFIAGAGMSAALPGFIASVTTKPVIGVPIDSGLPGGIDSVFSILQMPPGVPVAAVAVGSAGARNAAILAAEILALSNESIAERLADMRRGWRSR